MALFHTTVLDNQIKALPTVDTATGSIASFNTNLTENLVSCVCEVESGSDAISVFVNSINIWNEQWEVGAFSVATGEKLANPNRIRSKNLIRVFPNTVYYVTIGGSATAKVMRILYCDVNGDYLGSYQDWIHSGSFTTPANCYTIKFCGNDDYGTPYNNDISINYPSTDTQYHAFNGVYVSIGETLSDDGTFDVLSGILTRSDDTTKQLNANYIQTLNGENNIWCDTGDTEVKYLLTVGKKIS